jgi:hypothetical protein
MHSWLHAFRDRRENTCKDIERKRENEREWEISYVDDHRRLAITTGYGLATHRLTAKARERLLLMVLRTTDDALLCRHFFSFETNACCVLMPCRYFQPSCIREFSCSIKTDS